MNRLTTFGSCSYFARGAICRVSDCICASNAKALCHSLLAPQAEIIELIITALGSRPSCWPHELRSFQLRKRFSPASGKRRSAKQGRSGHRRLACLSLLLVRRCIMHAAACAHSGQASGACSSKVRKLAASVHVLRTHARPKRKR